MVRLKNNHIMEIQRIIEEDDRVRMEGLRWMPEQTIYENRVINSANQHMYELNNQPLMAQHWNLDQVEDKLIRFAVDLEEDGGDKKFVIPLLH